MIRTKEDLQCKIYEIMAEVTEINYILSESETITPILSANIYNKLCPISKDITVIKNTIKFMAKGK